MLDNIYHYLLYKFRANLSALGLVRISSSWILSLLCVLGNKYFSVFINLIVQNFIHLGYNCPDFGYDSRIFCHIQNPTFISYSSPSFS